MVMILWWVLDAMAWIAMGYCVARWAGPSVLPRWMRIGARLRASVLGWLDDRRSRWWAHALRVRLHRPRVGSWWTDGARRALLLAHDGGRIVYTDERGAVRETAQWGSWVRHVRPMTATEGREAEGALRACAEVRVDTNHDGWCADRAAAALDVAWSHRGPWVQLSSGHRWYPLTPRAEEVHLEDLSAPVIRWSGACGQYMTHEHQIRVARLLKAWGCSALVQLEGATHDGHEGLPPGDVPSPMKRAGAYGREASALEALAESSVRERYCLPREMSADVKRADAVLLATEARDLLPGGPLPGLAHVRAEDPLPARIVLAPSEPWRLRWVQLVARLADQASWEERVRAGRDDDRDALRRADVLRGLSAEARALACVLAGEAEQDAPTEAIDFSRRVSL